MSRYSVEIPGRYTWQLLFAIDLKDGGTFNQTIEKTFERKISVKTFREHVAQKLVATGIEVAQDVEASGKFKIVSVKAKSSTKFSHHQERLDKLTTSSTSQEDIKESVTVSTNFKVNQGEKLSIYALQFDMPGFHDVYDVLSSDPTNEEVLFEVVVEAAFQWSDSLLKVAQCLVNTHPRKDNKAEWQQIRTALISNVVPIAITDPVGALKNMLSALKTISPKRANKSEWEAIRRVSEDSLARVERGEYEKAFRNIVDQFRQTAPQHDNKSEWEQIRAVSSEVWRDL